MERRSKRPGENNNESQRNSKFKIETDRMDYEGGNRGKKGSNKEKTEKEDVDTNDANPRPQQPRKA